MKLLGDVTERVSTWNPVNAPSSSVFDYIDLSAVDNVRKEITGAVRLPTNEAPSRARQLVAVGDVLVSTVRPNLNAVAVVPPTLDGATASTGFTVLRPTDEVDGRYLFHWVRTRTFIDDMVRKATGASYPAVSDRIVKESALPLPPVDEQRRIASVLDKADALRIHRRRALACLDEFAQAIFPAVFRDFEKAEFRSLAELADIASGLTKGRKLNGQQSRAVPYLAVANVQDGHLKLDAVKTIEATESEISRYALQSGDLVLTEGGDPDKLGRGTIWRGELPLALHQNHIFRVRLHENAPILPEYLSAFIAGRDARAYFLKAAKQTTGIASINMTQLKALPVFVPDLHLQRQYVRMLALARVQQQLALRHAGTCDNIFLSLQSRAFSGQCDWQGQS